MLYPIALCAVLLILAITDPPQVLADPSRPGATSHGVEPSTPAFRAYERMPQKPKVIDVRIPDATLRDIARWLSENAELPHSAELPQIAFASPQHLHQLRYKGLLPETMNAAKRPAALKASQRELVALYDDSTRTIYLPLGWTGKTASQRSVLVHEMVHHLQNIAELKYPCGGAREKPAYLAQRKWLDLHGLDMEKEFDVDMFTIVALSACM